jgi:MGT family glycosyltransferase
LIVVSLGTTFMHQGALMVRICDALAQLDARVLLLTGNAVDPADLVLPSGVEVRAFVPHLAVLPEASLLVTHAGMGSLMAAFATGVPTLCVPLGRDQATNAQRALELGTSITVGADAAAPEVAAAASRALGSPELRHNAGQMRAAVAGYDTARLAGEALEAIAGFGQSRRARRLLVPAG